MGLLLSTAHHVEYLKIGVDRSGIDSGNIGYLLNHAPLSDISPARYEELIKMIDRTREEIVRMYHPETGTFRSKPPVNQTERS